MAGKEVDISSGDNTRSSTSSQSMAEPSSIPIASLSGSDASLHITAAPEVSALMTTKTHYSNILIIVWASDHGVIIVIDLDILGTSVGRFTGNQQIGSLEKKMKDVHTIPNPIKTTLVHLFRSARNKLTNYAKSSIHLLSMPLRSIHPTMQTPPVDHVLLPNLVQIW